jgi:hypothetical protein
VGSHQDHLGAGGRGPDAAGERRVSAEVDVQQDEIGQVLSRQLLGCRFRPRFPDDQRRVT